jgi:hypothetical protein
MCRSTLICIALASILIRKINTSAFQALPPSPLQRSNNNFSITKTRTITLFQSHYQDGDDDGEEENLFEFFVSPEQILVLRKEANKRERNKKLLKFFLPREESLAISQQSKDEISSLFEKSELIEVRGLSKDQKKGVFDAAYSMAEFLEVEIGKPVAVVEIKGCAVRLYCPWLEDKCDSSKRIKLFTSYRPGQWTRKPKPIRNAFGQIVTDENGKSIKEIPMG